MQTNVTELVLEARCAMAMSRVIAPLDIGAAFDHCRAARRWAYRAGAASTRSTQPPLHFVDSPTLIGAWQAGQDSRPQQATRRPSLVAA